MISRLYPLFLTILLGVAVAVFMSAYVVSEVRIAEREKVKVVERIEVTECGQFRTTDQTHFIYLLRDKITGKEYLALRGFTLVPLEEKVGL